MYIHRLKVIMYVYDVSASYRHDLPIFLEELIFIKFVLNIRWNTLSIKTG